MFKSKKNPFGDYLFNMVNLDGDGEFLSFSEFVTVVSTYALFGPEEILRFAFNCVDEDKSGFVSLAELDNLFAWLHTNGSSNLNTALNKIKEKYDKGDGQINYENFKKIQREFPFVLHPAFKLQEDMHTAVLGLSWWKKKQKELGMIKFNEPPVGPSVVSAILPTVFPAANTAAAVASGGFNKMKDAYKVMSSRAPPPPGPELIANKVFVAEVARVEIQIEAERKARVKQAALGKKEMEFRELQLIQARIQKRRQRMFSVELLNTDRQPMKLVHEPIPVVKVNGH